MDESEPVRPARSASRPARTVRVDMMALEAAFDRRDETVRYYLDTETGNCVAIPEYGFEDVFGDDVAAAVDLIDSAPSDRFVLIDGHRDVRPSIGDAREFISDVEDEQFKSRLQSALGRRRGAFREFLNVLHEQPGELERWYHIRRQRMWQNIAARFESDGLLLVYEPPGAYVPRHRTRQHLLVGATVFVDRARRIAGVERISLIGSMASSKKDPKDIDLLVTLSSTAELASLAATGRRLKGHAQQINRGADVFLADRHGRYLGRTCPWRECVPGIRIRCEAQHCGTYLYDDLHAIALTPEIIAAPPVEIWPNLVCHAEVPADVLHAFAAERSHAPAR